MIPNKKIFYWSPHINNQIATIKSVINSALSLKKFSRQKLDISIINVFGEWDEHKEILMQNQIEIKNLKIFKIKLPINGFFKSRLFYIFISFFSIFKIIQLLKKNNPDFFIAHLIVMPILFISRFLSFDTKFILRISGYPILNKFRFLLWKFLGKKLYAITCPTESTKLMLLSRNIFEKHKIFTLNDPIFGKEAFSNRYKSVKNHESKYILAIGRLTKQKNFIFLIKNFYKIYNKIPDHTLLIIGSGEEKTKLENKIKELNMMSKIKILSYQKNIFNYYRNADLFVLTSLWEDPGFVLLEAAMNNLLVLSSDCPNGPAEFIDNDIRGFSYNSNNNEEFQSKLLYVLKNLNTKETLEKKINAKKFCRKFTFFKHYQSFSKILKIL